MPRPVVALIALAFCGAALAGATQRESNAPALEWAAPGPEIDAVAGETLTLSWRPRAGEAPDFEEWEAFLSLDGGAHWTYRLTPHLDRRIERFAVELPPVASSHARLMLRYGDEREERELLLPFELTIAAPRRFVARPEVRLSEESGEAAREGQAGVVAWVDGPRDGAPLVKVECGAALELRGGPELAVEVVPPFGLAESAPEAPPPAARAPYLDPLTTSESALAVASEPRAASGGSLRLALLGRRNE